MNLEKQLLNIEEKFWKGDSEFYRQNLTDDCLMVLPEPAGILTKEEVVDAIAASRRWAGVAFKESQILQLAVDAAVLIYNATARREGDKSTYSALVSSGYVIRDGVWKLAFHQQTPLGETM
jgi:hypothetical protein